MTKQIKRPSGCRLILIAALMLITPQGRSGKALAHSPDKALTQYNHKVWNSENGLPQNSVFSILQSRSGYIWFGTEEGLVRFDGARFTVFNTQNSPKMNHNFILNLFEDREGVLWIGTRNAGLLKFKDGDFTSYTDKFGLPNHYVSAICEAPEGGLWLGFYGGGLVRYKDGKFVRHEINSGPAGDHILSLYADKEGSVWIGTDGGGLVRYKDGNSFAYTTENGLAGMAAASICKTSDGGLWIGTEGGLSVLRNGRFENYTVKDGLAGNAVASVFEDSEKNLWIGTDGGGLSRFRNGKFESFTTKEGLSNNSVTSFCEDREGGIWIGTDSGGLNRLQSVKFKTYTSMEGLLGDRVRAIFEDSKGAVWIGSQGGGLNRFKDGAFAHYTAKDGLDGDHLRSLYETSDGSLWIGVWGKGISRFKDGKFTAYTPKNGLSNYYVRAMCEGNDGSLWISTDTGLNRLKNGKFTIYTVKDGLPSNMIRTVYKTKDGHLWAGASEGLVRFEGDGFTVYSTKNGLSNNFITSLYEDAEGTLWIGTGGGLSRLKDNRIASFTFADGLFDDVVHAILEDAKGNLWLSSNKGISRTSKKELDDFAAGKIRRIASVSYGTADGMKSGECNGGSQQAACRTSDGKLWFATIKGATVIDPNEIKLNLLPPPVLIEQISINGTAALLNEKIEFPVEKGHLSIEYAGLSFAAPDKVLFKYKLEGYDKDWIDAGVNRIAHYTNLPPGPYRFRVIASNNDGIWNEEGAAIKFYLIPRFHQTIWFYAICAAALALLAAGAHQLRIRKMKTQEIELSYCVNERTAELRREIAEREKAESEMLKAKEEAESAVRVKSDFLANMSHEIRTPLNAIIGMSALLMDTTLSAKQQEFAETIRTSGSTLLTIINDILDFSKIESGKIVFEKETFRPTDCIEEALDMLAFKAGEKGLDLYYTVDEEAPQAIIGDITRLRQILINLINNSVKFTHRGEVAVTLNVNDCGPLACGFGNADAAVIEGSAIENPKLYELHFTIRDTGVGIPKDRIDQLFQPFTQADASTTRQYGGTGLGLVISKRLCEMMGGRIWAESVEGKGSIFHFTILAESVESNERPHQIKEQPHLAGKRLLIADDSAVGRIILKGLAERWGMKTTVCSEAEALKSLEDGDRFDLAVLDSRLFDAEGPIQIAEALRRTDEHPTPIALLGPHSTEKSEKALREEYGSFADILSKPLKPARFYQTLMNLFGEGAADKIVKEVQSREKKQLNDASSLRILIGEDNPVNQKVALRMLERIGCKADVASNGLEVVQALQRKSYDVILMDVQMPIMDGLEASRIICSQWPKERRPRIIAATASILQRDREQCLKAGMDDFIGKPFDLNDLKAALSDAATARAPLSPDSSPKSMDLSKLMNLKKRSDDETVLELIEIFIEDAPLRLAGLRNGVRDANAKSIEREAHKLKSSSAVIGAMKMSAISAELETLGRASSFEGIKERLSELEREFQCIRVSLEQEFPIAKTVKS